MNDDFLSNEDEELLLKNFSIVDPEKTEGLIDIISPEADIEDIEAKYDVTPPEDEERPRVYCAYCKGRRHWKGYLVKLKNGDKALLGNTCGSKQFGLDFQTVENQFKAANDRQTNLKRLLQIKAIFPSFLIELSTLISSSNTSEYDRYITDFRSNFAKLGQALAKSIDENGGLSAAIKVRDLAGEERRVHDENPDLIERANNADTPENKAKINRQIKDWMAKQPKKWKFEPRLIGSCEGLSLFTADPSPRKVFQSASVEAEKLYEFISKKKSNELTNHELSKLFKEIRKVVSKLDSGLGLFRKLMRFTSIKNLQTISEWSALDDREDIAFQLKNGALCNTSTNTRLQLPSTFSVPETPRRNDLMKAYAVMR